LKAESDAIDSGGERAGADANGVLPNIYSDIGAAEFNGVVTWGQKIFWAQDDGIYRANANGTGVQKIYHVQNSPVFKPVDIEFYSDPTTDTYRIFWSESNGVNGR